MTLKNNSRWPIIAVLVVAALVGFGAMYAVAQNASKGAGSASASRAVCKGTCIALEGKTASPDVVTVETGSYVQFNSADGGRHNIALEHAAVQHEDHSEYESGEFGGDEAWRVQFKRDGSYTFRDTHNPGLKVTVVAYTPGKDYKIQ